MDERTVSADVFLQTLENNVDNKRLTDRQFRQFIRDTLPIVIYNIKETDYVKYPLVDKILKSIKDENGKTNN